MDHFGVKVVQYNKISQFGVSARTNFGEIRPDDTEWPLRLAYFHEFSIPIMHIICITPCHQTIETPNSLRDDIKSCKKISIWNSFKIALPPPSPGYLNPEFPISVLE